MLSQSAHLRFLHFAEREAHEIELVLRGGKQEVALVAAAVCCGIERPAAIGPLPA